MIPTDERRPARNAAATANDLSRNRSSRPGVSVSARAEAQRILDAVARRLLNENHESATT